MNRRQRRAQGVSTKGVESADDIPLVQPTRSKPTTKTLYDIAAEKQAELLSQAEARELALKNQDKHQPLDGEKKEEKFVNVKVGPDGQIVREDGTPFTPPGATDDAVEDPDSTLPPIVDTLFLASSLSACHFTLETLTVHQYAQELRFPPIIKDTLLVAFPFLFLLIHLFHGHLIPVSTASLSARAKTIVDTLKQLIYVAIANVAGCYLIQLTNEQGYYAVMKNAPSVGTIWVWSVIELGLAGALAGVAGPAFFAWWYGYGF